MNNPLEKIVSDFRKLMHVEGEIMPVHFWENVEAPNSKVILTEKIKTTRRAESNEDFESILEREKVRWQKDESYVIRETKITIEKRIAEINFLNDETQRPTVAPLKEAYNSFLVWLNGRGKMPNDKQKEPSAPVKAAFCKMVEGANIIGKTPFDTIEQFCKQVCQKYALRYTDNVRQAYGDKPTKKHNESVIKLIFPTIPKKDKVILTTYLNNNNKVYG